MSKTRNYPKWAIWLRRILILGMISLSGYFIYKYYWNLHLLKKDGIFIKAYIYDMHKDSSIFSNNLIKKYLFVSNGKLYKGSSGFHTSSVVGDSVCIVILNKDPEINELCTTLNKWTPFD